MVLIDETEQVYQATPQHTNCQPGGIISNINQCVTAAQKLNRKYIGRTTSSNRPAGCYYSSNKRAYFNTITDPSSTRPKKFGDRGGICTTEGTLGMLFFLLFVNDNNTVR